MRPERSEPMIPTGGWRAEPVDPETAVDPWPARTDSGPRRRQGAVLAAIAVGGAIGGCARYGATLLWPTLPGGFPWTTLWINIIGSAALGALMVLITEWRPAHPLMRPFLATGVLGGFTTFSTYAVEAQQLSMDGRAGTALLYLGTTVAAALLALWASASLTRAVVFPRQDRPDRQDRREGGS